MRIIKATKHHQPSHLGCIGTIGNFDGLHQGHRNIINQVKALAGQYSCPAMVISFEPLPTEFFSQKLNKPAPGRIYPFRDKARILHHLGIDEFVCLKFTDTLSEMEPEDFIKDILIGRLNIKHLIVGDDFCFGKNRRGDFKLLCKLGNEMGMNVSSTETIMQEDQRISSTRIREHLSKGKLTAANKLLVEAYQLSGRIRHGDKRGRTIGFPTLNQRLPEDIIVTRGAYAVKIRGLGTDVLFGIANIGKRPTFSGLETRLETYVFKFDQQVYGKYACIELVKFLRAEQKFEDFNALVAQIGEDSERAKEFFKKALK